MPNVYLAGPIAHLTFDEANFWRKYATNYLNNNGILGVSPLRGKEFLVDRGPTGLAAYDEPMASDAGIVSRDRSDVENADMVLVNLLGASKVSCGTPVEYGWADILRVPVVTVMEKEGSVYDHPFIRRISSYRVETLQEGLDICVAVLS